MGGLLLTSDDGHLAAYRVLDLGLPGLAARANDIGCGPVQTARALSIAREQYSKGEALCESPIECIALAALITAKWPAFLTVPPLVHDGRRDKAVPTGDLVIVPQMPVARFRLDFGVLVEWEGARHVLAVECDGIDHHAYVPDRERDLYLASWGIPTFRLFGNELYRDAHALMSPIIGRVCEWRDAKLTDLREAAVKTGRARHG